MTGRHLGLQALVYACAVAMAGCNCGVPPAEKDGGSPASDSGTNLDSPDADSDTILNLTEGAPASDTDKDGLPDFIDPDSDGDGIPDVVEAGDADLGTSPVDTDSDGTPNFRDLDSDDDGVPDNLEDPNGNGVVDPGESSTLKSDTDGDGIPDIVERVAGTNPSDAASKIPTGDFYFVLPYQGQPVDATFDFTTSVRKADVLFSVDTTGSMEQEIANIQASLGTILSGVRAAVPNTAFGVGRFADFPYDPFGLPGDRPYRLLQRITLDDAQVASGINALPPATGGNSRPESGYEALFQWSAGLGLPAFDMLPYDWQPGFQSNLGHGQFGGAGFRSDALPIIVHVTDARSHEANEYPASFGAHSRADALSALGKMSARVIGINSLENAGTSFDARAQLEDLAAATNAMVPATGTPPSCPTGVNATARPTYGTTGKCALVFDVNTDGSGLGSRVIDAIQSLTSLGTIDISSRAQADPALLPGLSTARFIRLITPVPPPPAGASINGDYFLGVTTGSTVTFRFYAVNDFVPSQATDQLFKLNLEVVGDFVTTLDVRTVYVIVPRAILGGIN